MEKIFIAAKYQNKWAVLDLVSRTFSHIGLGKRFCEKKALELNDELDDILKDPIFNS